MLKDLTSESLVRLHIHAKDWEDAVRQAIWDEVNNRYKFAVDSKAVLCR